MTKEKERLLKIIPNNCIDSCKGVCINLEEKQPESDIKRVTFLVSENDCFISLNTEKFAKEIARIKSTDIPKNCDGVIILCNGKIKTVIFIELKTTLSKSKLLDSITQLLTTMDCLMDLIKIDERYIEENSIMCIIFRKIKENEIKELIENYNDQDPRQGFYSSRIIEPGFKIFCKFVLNKNINSHEIPMENRRLKFYKKQITEETTEINIDEILQSSKV